MNLNTCFFGIEYEKVRVHVCLLQELDLYVFKTTWGYFTYIILVYYIIGDTYNKS